ncbi:hypothetical protein Tco_0599927 [Tanacetum coccineum]
MKELWEADVVSEHFDRDDNAGDDNEETKPDPEEIYNSGPGPQLLTPRTISSGLVPQPPSPTPNVPPTKNDWDSLFCPMFDEYFNPSPSVVQHVLVAVVQEPVVSTGTPSSTRIDQDTPSTSTSQTTQEEQSHVIPTSVEEDDHGIEVAHMDNDLPVSTRLQLQTEALFCYYDALLSSSEHKSYKDALTESCWIDAMKSSMSSSEGSGITPEVPDEPKDNSAVVAEKQAGYVQTNLTLSSAELEIQSMVDVPIHQEDLVVQRTPLIDPDISMTFQEEFRSVGWCKENIDGQKIVAEDTNQNAPLLVVVGDDGDGWRWGSRGGDGDEGGEGDVGWMRVMMVEMIVVGLVAVDDGDGGGVV